ncbi:hypothetical protein VT98_12523, partial [Candidatus Electrothrix communis]
MFLPPCKQANPAFDIGPHKKLGLRSQIGAFTQINCKEYIDKKILRFMGNAAAFAYIA